MWAGGLGSFNAVSKNANAGQILVVVVIGYALLSTREVAIQTLVECLLSAGKPSVDATSIEVLSNLDECPNQGVE